MRPITFLAACALASSLAPAVARAGDCPDLGYCHLAPWGLAGAAFDDRVGAAVALEGDMAAVGSIDRDLVRIHRRVGTQWVESQTLVDPEGIGHRFGATLAIDGGRLFVGAPTSDLAAPDAGAVHVYERVGTTWVHVDVLLDATPWAGARFGAALDAHGQWLAVGAPDDSGTGRVHVWSFESGAPQFVRLVGDALASVEFGASVALHRPQGSAAGFLFVGDPGDAVAGVNAGAVRYFRVSPFETAFGPVLRPDDVGGSDRFGAAIAFDGAHLVAGAPGDDELALNSGAAYVYDVPPPGPLLATLAGKLTPCEGGAGAQFGAAVAVRGTRIAVGALESGAGTAATDDAEPVVQRGAVRLFVPAVLGTSWTARGRIEPADASARAFGAALALGDDVLLVGAPLSDIVTTKAGAAYLVSTAPSNLLGGVCPSTHLATAVTYGVPKPGPMGVATLALTKPPVPGTSTSIVVGGLHVGSVPVLLVGFAPAVVPFDGGFLLVQDPTLLFMPQIGFTGKSGLVLPVPADPAIAGLPLFFQAMAVDGKQPGGLHTVQTAGLAVAPGF